MFPEIRNTESRESMPPSEDSKRSATDSTRFHSAPRQRETEGLDHIAPHDLRRTCAKLCHTSGGELEQIQFLLGHASVQTTERYLGCKQNLGSPVNDRFALGMAAAVPLLKGSEFHMGLRPTQRHEN